MSQELTDFEGEVYNFIKEHRELLTTNIPMRMRGAVPTLKNKGLIEVFKRRMTPRNEKKRKFVRVKEKSLDKKRA